VHNFAQHLGRSQVQPATLLLGDPHAVALCLHQIICLGREDRREGCTPALGTLAPGAWHHEIMIPPFSLAKRRGTDATPPDGKG